MRHGAVSVAAIAGLLAACSSHEPQAAIKSTSTIAYSALANGQAIFRTGRDLDGLQIRAQNTPLYGDCEACHRANGSGGMRLPNGAVSADLRYPALVAEQKHPYTAALLERAISTGIDNEGQRLNPVMPHWKLSARDLHDIALYVAQGLK